MALALLGLPRPDGGLHRLLSGGNDVEIHDLARPGDRISAQSTIVDVYEKRGRSGVLVFVVTESVYEALNRDAVLPRSRQTHTLR